MLYKFKPGDILHNRIKTYPKCDFVIYDRKVFYNSKFNESGTFTNPIVSEQGAISLYEENVDRPVGQEIYPFIVKGGSLDSFKTISTTTFNSEIQYGDVMTASSYPLTASISKDYFASGQARNSITSLKNTLENYRIHSPHYAYNLSNFGNKSTQEIGLISIPSIFYGSRIEKGTVDLKFYVTGTLIAQAKDEKKNGELIQTGPTGSNGSGSVLGVCLYREGFMVLTGAWDITTEHTEPYVPGVAAQAPKWVHFGSTGSTGASENLPNSSFNVLFKGRNYVNVMTMNCHAPKGELNWSNNPTSLEFNQTASLTAITSSNSYREHARVNVKNVAQSPFTGHTASFEKTTYISKIGIYDKHRNLIAVAKVASPTRKRERDSFTYRIRWDL